MNGLNIKAALCVAWKDIKIFLKERGTVLYLFVVPIVFVLGFSGAAAVGGEPEERAITLATVNLDAASEASLTLMDTLRQRGIDCELYDQARADAWLERGKLSRVLIIPANYDADLQAGRSVTLRLVNSPDADDTATEAVHRVVTGVAADLSLQTQLIASFRQMGDMQAAGPSEQQAFTADIVIEQAQSQYERTKTEPLLAVDESWPEHLQDEGEEDLGALSVTVPGFAVLFIFLTAQTTAQSIYEEKKVGSFRRLLAAPVSKMSVLAGKMTPNLVTGLAQIVVLFGTGVVLLPLVGLERMTLGNDPLALGLVCLIILLCSTALGLLIAAIARTEGQITGLSQVVLWVCGFAGILLAGMPSGSLLDSIRRVIPHYWANAAFVDLLVRGQGLADIMPSILPLLGFTVAFLVVGLWRFKFD
jgi:ABC-2 type transport system permease protein